MTREERIAEIRYHDLCGFELLPGDVAWLLSELEKADAKIANLHARALPKTEEG